MASIGDVYGGGKVFWISPDGLTGINFSGLADLYIGNGFAGPNDYSGYIDEIRISNTARYGGVNFSVPTSSYCQ